jgi:hypothetical protein
MARPRYRFPVGNGKGESVGDVRVELSKFNTDRKRYMLEASTERRVFVYHDGTQQISAVFGGSLGTSSTDDVDVE